MFTELFPFLANERDDVRKMASSGVAQLSKDNKELCAFLADPANKAHLTCLVELIDPKLPASSLHTLGDVLLTVVNASIDAACCDALVTCKVPMKLLKVYESLATRRESGSGNGSAGKKEEIQSGAALGELALMALNNLTATSVAACEQVLELADDDLAGYSFGRLKAHYDRCNDVESLAAIEAADAELREQATKEAEEAKKRKMAEKGGANDNNDDDEEEAEKIIETVAAARIHSAAAASNTATHRKWILQIVLNVCRIKEGMHLFFDDEEWRGLLVPLVAATEHLYTRSLGAQLIRNLVNFREAHARLVDEAKVCAALVAAVCVRERDSTLLHAWVDILAQLITTEDGMRGMDQINAKRMLVAAVKESTELHRAIAGPASSAAASASSSAAAQHNAPQRTVPLPWDVIKRINEELLPFLEDIQEVWMPPKEDDDEDDD